MRHALAHRIDHAGHGTAGHERQLRANLVVAADQQAVEVADADAGNRDPDLAGSRLRGFGDVCHRDRGRIAESVNLDGLHESYSSGSPGIMTQWTEPLPGLRPEAEFRP